MKIEKTDLKKNHASSKVPYAPLETDTLGRKKAKSYQTKHKTEAALRILGGESLEALSHEYGVTVGRLLFWKETFVGGGEECMQLCDEESDDSAIERLKKEIEWQRSKNEELRQELRRYGCTPMV